MSILPSCLERTLFGATRAGFSQAADAETSHRKRRSMRHPTFLAAIAVTLAHLAVSPATAGTIYDIVDYSGAGFQNGVVLTGSITTDGTMGVYNDSSHIEGWTLTFTSGTAS